MKVYDNLDISKVIEAKPDITCIGAFDGIHLGHQALIKLAKTISSNYQILTFEPVPKNIDDFKINISLNKCNNITLISKALSNVNLSLIHISEPTRPY